MSWAQHIFVDPSVAGAIFLAQVATFALIQIWRAGRDASRGELGGRPRHRRDILHLFLTGLAVVLGLVLLIIWISHPIDLPHFGSQGNVLPVVVFLTFIYVTLVIGINSSHRTSGDKSNPWLAALLLFTAALLARGDSHAAKADSEHLRSQTISGPDFVEYRHRRSGGLAFRGSAT